jgi:hypothetical protein
MLTGMEIAEGALINELQKRKIILSSGFYGRQKAKEYYSLLQDF